ncbi:MAG: hypothetical protein M9894_01515 [Planctomycetes bacterium]|nr:hypothetical protein [Planctomycetota bacterium]
MAPLVVPPFLVALGWLDLVGPGGRVLRALGVRPPGGPSLLAQSPLYTPWACGLLLGAALHPIPLLAARAALRRLDPACLEAARLARGTRGARQVALAVAAPAAGAGAALVLVLALLERATPLLVLRGIPVPGQVEEVALRFAAERDPWLAARAGVPLVGAALVALGALLLAWRLPGRAARGAPLPAGRGVRVVGPLVALLLAAPGLLVPLASVALQVADVARSTGADAWAELALAFRLGAPDAARSALVGVGAAAVTVGVGAAVAWGLRPSRERALAALAAVAVVAAALTPPPVVGAALDAAARAAPALDPLADGPAIVVVACALRFSAVALAFLVVAVRRVPPEEVDAARLARRWPVRVVVPQVLPAALAAALVVHVLTVTEYGASAVVEPPGASLLAVFVVNEAHYGAGPALAGLLTLLLAVAAAPVAAGLVARAAARRLRRAA